MLLQTMIPMYLVLDLFSLFQILYFVLNFNKFIKQKMQTKALVIVIIIVCSTLQIIKKDTHVLTQTPSKSKQIKTTNTKNSRQLPIKEVEIRTEKIIPNLKSFEKIGKTNSNQQKRPTPQRILQSYSLLQPNPYINNNNFFQNFLYALRMLNLPVYNSSSVQGGTQVNTTNTSSSSNSSQNSYMNNTLNYNKSSTNQNKSLPIDKAVKNQTQVPVSNSIFKTPQSLLPTNSDTFKKTNEIPSLPMPYTNLNQTLNKTIAQNVSTLPKVENYTTQNIPILTMPKIENKRTQNTSISIATKIEDKTIQNNSISTPTSASTYPLVSPFPSILPSSLPSISPSKSSMSPSISPSASPSTLSPAPPPSAPSGSSILEYAAPIRERPKSIVSNQFAFSGVGLYHQVPLSFMQGELFRFSGEILNQQSPNNFYAKNNYNFINIIFKIDNFNEFRCDKPLQDGKSSFQVSCKIEKQGTYFLMIFPGSYGTSSRNQRIVRSFKLFSPYSLTIEQFKPQKLSYDIEQNRLAIKWATDAPLTNLTISQNSSSKGLLKRQYLLSNYHAKFNIPFNDFFEFDQSKAILEISHADSDDGTLNKINSRFSKDTARIQFSAFKHCHHLNKEQLYNITPPIPWRVRVGETIKFNGVFQQDIRNLAFLIEPSQKVTRLFFMKNITNTSATIRANTPTQLQFTLNQAGTYILEINGHDGQAIVNQPIYVGEGIPILPDFDDLIDELRAPEKQNQKLAVLEQYLKKTTTSEIRSEPSKSASLSTKRQYLLYLLNNLRRKHNAGPVSIDETLNRIAQYHADDMTANNYMGHISLNGDTPSMRAKKFNFSDEIGENIAWDNTLSQAHLGLQRSAGHLQNSIKPSWTRVGIGISAGKSSQYIVTFEFSSRDLAKNPLTSQQIMAYEEQILSLVKQKNPRLRENSSISQYIRQWFNSSESDLINFIFRRGSLYGSISYRNMYFGYSDDLIGQIKDSHYLEGYNDSQEFGLALRKKNQASLIDIYVVFYSKS